MNARSYKTNGIVLRSRNLGEADRIVTVLTEVQGKRDVVARGVRRLGSRTASRLELGSEAFFLLHHGRTLDVVTSADLLRSRRPAITRPEGYVTAHAMLELVDAFSEPDLALPEVYTLLNGALDALGLPEPCGLLPRFQARLLQGLGLAPYAAACVECGGALESRAWAVVEAGGLCCSECHVAASEHLALEQRDIHNFRALAAPRAAGARAVAVATPAAARAIEAFLLYHLGRRWKSQDVMRSIPFFLP